MGRTVRRQRPQPPAGVGARIPSPSLRGEGQGAEQGIGADTHGRGCGTPSSPGQGASARPRALLHSGRPCTFISL